MGPGLRNRRITIENAAGRSREGGGGGEGGPGSPGYLPSRLPAALTLTLRSALGSLLCSAIWAYLRACCLGMGPAVSCAGQGGPATGLLGVWWPSEDGPVCGAF